jgi:hypothetical protein
MARSRASSAALLALLGASCGEEPPLPDAREWPEATALFRSDPAWMGSDGAYSIDLGGDRSLWLFGDTLVAKPGTPRREDAFFLRNTVGIQVGRDPSRSWMSFRWRGTPWAPSSFFPEQGEVWLWPAHGARLGDRLLIFLSRVKKGDGALGFAEAGWTAALVENPDEDPLAWTIREATGVGEGPALKVQGAAVVVREGWVMAYGLLAGRLAHDAVLCRWPVEQAREGDLSAPACWDGQRFGQGTPEVVVPTTQTEFTVHHQPQLGRWVLVQSQGFGPTTLALRTAPSPEGPWTAPRSFFRPPRSFSEKAFVYAGKAHPQLTGADLIVTYATNVFPDENLTGDDLYYPRVVALRFQ